MEQVVITPELSEAARNLKIPLSAQSLKPKMAVPNGVKALAKKLSKRPEVAMSAQETAAVLEELAPAGMFDGFAWPRLPWTELYDSLTPGRFENAPILAWTGPDQFRFLQPVNPARQFVYVRADGTQIRPRAMDTDGGSIPWLASGVNGFSSWGYAPAFLIHDWLFVAHKCQFTPDDHWTFEETALLMAEAMKTLIVKAYPKVPGRQALGQKDKIDDGGPRTVYTMFQAVFSSKARRLFNDSTTVTCYLDNDLQYTLDYQHL